MEISASSCYILCNGEFVGRPWCSQLDVYTSACLDVVAVALSSEVPDSCDIPGVLAKDYTCGALENNRIDGEDRNLSLTLFPLNVFCDLDM